MVRYWARRDLSECTNLLAILMKNPALCRKKIHFSPVDVLTIDDCDDRGRRNSGGESSENFHSQMSSDWRWPSCANLDSTAPKFSSIWLFGNIFLNCTFRFCNDIIPNIWWRTQFILGLTNSLAIFEIFYVENLLS